MVGCVRNTSIVGGSRVLADWGSLNDFGGSASARHKGSQMFIEACDWMVPTQLTPIKVFLQPESVMLQADTFIRGDLSGC